MHSIFYNKINKKEKSLKQAQETCHKRIYARLWALIFKLKKINSRLPVQQSK